VAVEFYRLIISILVVWRITHLVQGEDGPWNLIVRLRQWVGQGFWSGLLDCFYCLSLWVAVPAAVLTGQGWKQRLVLWPALSAGAIILERISSRHEPVAPVIFSEDEPSENEHGEDEDKEKENVLRQRQSPTESEFKTSRA
jgi:hypothetical protein